MKTKISKVYDVTNTNTHEKGPFLGTCSDACFDAENRLSIVKPDGTTFKTEPLLDDPAGFGPTWAAFNTEHDFEGDPDGLKHKTYLFDYSDTEVEDI